MEKPEKHNINLSRQVWGELKLRSFQEGASASEIIVYVLEQFFQAPPAQIRIARYQPRTGEALLGRSVYFPGALWQTAQSLAREHNFSVAGLIEQLLKNYLGLEPGDEPIETSLQASNSQRYVQLGSLTIDLGDENPLTIDYKTGKQKK
jgi:hypothetical protein